MRLRRIALSLLIFLLATAVAFGVSSYTGKSQHNNTALVLSETTTLDANALEMFVYNDGNFAYDNIGVKDKTDGLYYPRGTKKTVIYSAGLWLGAKVDGEIRVAQAEYSSEFEPGPMVNGGPNPNWSDNEFRCYKLNRADSDENPDWSEWPSEDGAPVDEDGNPAILGDQMIWSVYNDANSSKHENESGGTDPMGIEVQQSTFAFARSGALGNCIFMKFQFINKGGETLESTFVSIWSDPDLGNAGDDLVGCDTTLSLGYCYNDGTDDIYGGAPPAVGFDFFQGPIVPDSGNVAHVSGREIPDYMNLPMTSFAKYINGEDPRSADQTYAFMTGLRKNPGTGLMEAAVDPETGDTTNFVLAGDPVTDEGWIDINSADRRFMMSSGPFTMLPNDTQEVVCAVLVGQGSNPLNSITALREVDEAAQTVFDLNFDIPLPPPAPTVYTRGGDDFIDLAWSSDAVGNIEADTTLGQEFHFEGYNLYQGETAAGPWHKFATYDEANEVTLIYKDEVNTAAGGSERIIEQKGSDSGLEFHYLVSRDEITGARLEANRSYYFAVTAYSYDILNVSDFNDPAGNFLGVIAATLESPIISYEVKPFSHVGEFSVAADHTSGGSDGDVFFEVIYPDEVTGHQYEVTFNEDDTWNVKDLNTNQFVVQDQEGQTPGYDFPVVDGIMIRAQGPSLGVKSVAEVATADGPVDPPDNVNYSLNSTGDWYMDPGGDRSFSRYTWAGANTRDYEIRFTEAATEYCFDWFGAGDYANINSFQVPIEFWDIGVGTPDDDSDDRRICFMIIDDDESGSFSWGDGLYVWDLDYDDIPWDDPNYNTGVDDPDDELLHYGRWWFYDNSGALSRPAAGSVIRTVTNKVNTMADVFRFTTTKVTDAGGEFIELSLDNIKTVPNPYYAYYEEEVDQFDRRMKFINLPPAEMKIRIFNLAGDLIRTMERNGQDVYNPEFIWDLKTDEGIWVASGIYVWLIEAEGLGSTYGKMAIFTEVEQLDNF